MINTKVESFLKQAFPGVEWNITQVDESFVAIGGFSCFRLRVAHTKGMTGPAMTILCGGTRVFHDENQPTAEKAAYEGRRWLLQHIQECRKAIEP